MKERLKRAIIPELYRVRGQHRALIAHLDDMPVEALDDLHRVLQELHQEVRSANRTYRLWPHGPKFRV